MASLAEIESALRKADALAQAGDPQALADAKVLADAYRSMRDQETQSTADQARIAEAPFASRVVSAAAGIPFIGSWVDEMRGAIRGEDEAEAFRQTKAAMERENPTEDTLLGLGGGVAGAAASTLALPAGLLGGGGSLLARTLGGLGIGAVAGGTEGAIYGAGNEDDRTGGAASGALVGSVLGGGIGAAAPAAADGISYLVRALANRPSNAAVQAAGLSPTSTEAVLSALQADDALTGAGRARIAQGGPDAMMADAGQSARDLLDTAIQRSGRGANLAREATEGRAANAAQTVTSALDSLAPRGTAVSTGHNQMRALYDRAYSSPIDYSSDAGRRLEELLPRVPQAVVDRANRLIQMDTDAINPRQIMLGADGQFSELPNVLQLDYITRALQDVARAGDGMGALGGSTNEGRIYGKLARQIRSAVRETVPAYGQALDTAATEIGARQAREFGQTAMRPSVTRADLADEIAGMGKGELHHLRLGVRDTIEETLANVRRTVTDPNVDARQASQAVKDFSSDAAREKLRAIFGKEADTFLAKIDEATQALELRAGVATNSRTFGRQAVDRTIKERLHGGPVETLARGEPISASKGIVQALTGRTAAGNAAREEEVYAEIARLLTEPRGSDAVNTMLMLEQLMQTRPAIAASANQIGQGVAGALALPAYLLGQQSIAGR